MRVVIVNEPDLEIPEIPGLGGIDMLSVGDEINLLGFGVFRYVGKTLDAQLGRTTGKDPRMQVTVTDAEVRLEKIGDAPALAIVKEDGDKEGAE